MLLRRTAFARFKLAPGQPGTVPEPPSPSDGGYIVIPAEEGDGTVYLTTLDGERLRYRRG